MKILSPDITHKSDVGGVRINLRSTDEVRRAYRGHPATSSRQVSAGARRRRHASAVRGAALQHGDDSWLPARPDLWSGAHAGHGGHYRRAIARLHVRAAPLGRASRSLDARAAALLAVVHRFSWSSGASGGSALGNDVAVFDPGGRMPRDRRMRLEPPGRDDRRRRGARRG